MTYLLNGKFSMFESPSAFWNWVTGAGGATYIIIICVLAVLLIAALIFAFVKKARISQNDVNVLLLLGDDDKSVDAEIFKKNYAMVLVSKNDNTMTAAEKTVAPLVKLSDNSDEIEERAENVDESEVAARDDEFIIEDEISDEPVQEVFEEPEVETAQEGQEEAEEEYAETVAEAAEEVDETLAVVDSEEEIPFNEQPDDAKEEEIEELEEEIREDDNADLVDEAAAEIVAEPEEVAEEEIEDIAEEQIDAEEIEDVDVSEEETPETEIAEAEEEPICGENASVMEIVETENDETIEEAENDGLSVIAVIDGGESAPEDEIELEIFENEEDKKAETAETPSETIYDIDASDEYARDRIEVVDYIRVPGKVKGETSFIESDDAEVSDVPVVEDAKPEEPVEVSEEIFLIETDDGNAFETVEIEEDAETEETQEVESEAENFTEVEVQEIVPDEVAEAVDEPQEESEEAASAVVEVNADVVEFEDESESDAAFENTAAYTIVKEEEAVPEAIEAVQNGEVIVDANGDGIAAEVLVDKNILKARYKTVDLETRLRRADEATKTYYSELKNFLLSYEGVKSRISKKFDTFTIGRFIVAKMAVRGNVINLYLALASESIDDKYFAADVGDSETYGKTPTLHKVKSKRGCKYGIELIRDIMSELQIGTDEEYQPVDYAAAYPPENIDEKKDAIRHLFKNSVSVEDAGVLSDEEALEFIEIVKNKQYTINKFLPINKYVVFVDDLDVLYESGDTVTIGDLIEKEALPREENIFLEIRAKGTINKPLIVEAHSFDPDAIKMIILTDGKVIQYK